MNRNIVLALVAALAGGSHALAQSFNIDVGSSLSSLPSGGYGAAANQPGTWQLVKTDNHPVVTMKDITGTLTSVTITESGGNGDFGVSNSSWTGDDAALMVDASDCGGAGGSIVWTITGLAAGNYSIFTYAEAPDFPADYRTNVSVAGANQGTQLVGGAWNGSPHVQGVTYALHTLTVGAGANVTITTSTPSSPAGNLGSVNGFQIRKENGGGGAPTPYCFGDGTLSTPCPCGNNGLPGRGCQNSGSTGGALLTATGATHPDTLVLTSANELSTSSSVFLQGDTSLAGGIVFGDGLRCANGNLKRIAVTSASGGTTFYPHAGDPSISAASAALGDPIPNGATRYYQVYYRDSNLAFCAAPQGDAFNASNGLIVVW
jgi:hypothetical protein